MDHMTPRPRSSFMFAAMAAVTAALFLFGFAATVAAKRPSHHPVHHVTTRTALVRALRGRIRHVFVIYQENQSFDHYFGTYPGADNLATAEARSHGFRQYDNIGHRWITPFRITDPDIADTAHSRPALLAKMDKGRMDWFVGQQEYKALAKHSGLISAQRRGLLTMSYYDCDTIPFLWMYAHNFALYDHIFQGMTGPSTPGNIELIAAQTGATQWARNPSQAVAADAEGPGEPVVNDSEPASGPYALGAAAKVIIHKRQYDQRYATVMLTLSGKNDSQATHDTQGVRKDLAHEAASGREPIAWYWYQEGYRGPDAIPARGYVTHHNAPQYFGYLRHNHVFWNHVAGLGELLPALRQGTLPARGVFYIKGGDHNSFGWRPADKKISGFLGDDDHPGAGDAGRDLSESFVATFVNAIARSRYWRDSAIIITWDDEGGFYDHVPPPQFEQCPDGHPCGDGPRLPFILISPYARSGAVVHSVGDTASVVKFLDVLFQLPALASLPDEKPYLPRGPRDANARLTDLLGGFDPLRLEGRKPPIPASQAEIDDAVVNHFPVRMSCKSLGLTPVKLQGAAQIPPQGYAPRVGN